jgi:thiol-disulfide isomerase/thioredoxin
MSAARMRFVLVVLGMLACACDSPSAPAASAPSSPTQAPPSASAAQPQAQKPPPVPIRYDRVVPATPLPEFTIVRRGKPLPLAGPRPRPRLLHLWATWCGPCIEELPSLLAYGKKSGIEVIAVSVDDYYEPIVKFFDGNIPPEVAWDPKVTLEPGLGVRSLPTTFLLDKQGRVRMRWQGRQSWEAPAMGQLIVQELMTPVVDTPPPPPSPPPGQPR